MTKLKLALLAAAATLSLSSPVYTRKLRLVLRVLLLVSAAGSAGILGSTETLAQNAYITNNQSNYMSVINTVTNAVIATISVGSPSTTPAARAVAVAPDGSKVYVTSDPSPVAVINSATNTVAATWR